MAYDTKTGKLWNGWYESKVHTGSWGFPHTDMYLYHNGRKVPGTEIHGIPLVQLPDWF